MSLRNSTVTMQTTMALNEQTQEINIRRYTESWAYVTLPITTERFSGFGELNLVQLVDGDKVLSSRGWFYKRFKSSFCANRSQNSKKDTDDLTVFLHFWDLNA